MLISDHAVTPSGSVSDQGDGDGNRNDNAFYFVLITDCHKCQIGQIGSGPYRGGGGGCVG